MVKAACERILRDPALAEDAAQEVFLLLVRKLPSLPPQTILGGWLYFTACHLARTHQRTHARRWQRENQPEVMETLMNPAQDTLWRELEPLLDDAMLTLSERQRELVLSHYFQHNSQRTAAALVGCSESVASRELAAAPAGRSSPRTPSTAPVSTEAKPRPTYDEAALSAARTKLEKFWRRMGELALVGDPLKAQELLSAEFGIRLTVDEIRQLQERGQKGFTFGVIELWGAKQPQEALAWGASAISESGVGVDFHQILLDAARKSMPNLNRDTLAGMLPDGPGKTKVLDLLEATTDPYSLANRILAVTDPAERASRLRVLAQGWSNPETSAEWARQNLTGADKTAFYAQEGYNLAHQNPDAGFRVLGELQGTDAYASTFGAMMRGLVQIGGRGQEAAELIANSNLNPGARAELISELARRWVRQDADATVAWANNLTARRIFARRSRCWYRNSTTTG